MKEFSLKILQGKISTPNSIYNLYRTKQESFQFVKNQTTKHEKNILESNSNDLPQTGKIWISMVSLTQENEGSEGANSEDTSDDN